MFTRMFENIKEFFSDVRNELRKSRFRQGGNDRVDNGGHCLLHDHVLYLSFVDSFLSGWWARFYSQVSDVSAADDT